MARHDKDQLKTSLNIEDIKKLLYELGAEHVDYNEVRNEIVANTVCHNLSGGSHKLYYYPEGRNPDKVEPIFQCYTGCSCSMDIFELVRRNYDLRGIELSFSDTVNWVAEKSGRSFGFGFSVDLENRRNDDDWNWLNRFSKKKKVDHPELKTYSDRILNVFEDYHHPSFLEDNITHESMDKFDVMFYSVENKVVIPHRNIDGEIIGIKGRTLNQWEIDAGYKYMPMTIQRVQYNHPSYSNLYGLHQNKKTIQRLKKAIVFESEKSVLQCETYFPNNNFSVALSGRNISQQQIDMLLELGIEELIIATDKMFKEIDTKLCEEDIKFIVRMGRRFSPYIRTYTLFDEIGLLEYKDSPSDRGKDVLIALMKNKKEILNKE